jgi:hypothetical protein
MCGGEAEPAEVRILCNYLTGLDGLSNWNFWESVRNKEGALSAVPVACRRRHLLEFSWKAGRAWRRAWIASFPVCHLGRGISVFGRLRRNHSGTFHTRHPCTTIRCIRCIRLAAQPALKNRPAGRLSM